VRVAPPKGAPNVLLIMADDTGFGVFNTFDGVIPTPDLDRINANSLHYTNFNSTALCSPTRAALITGAQPPLDGLRGGVRAVNGLSRLQPHHDPGQCDHRQDPQGLRLQDIMVWKGPQHSEVRGEPGRSIRSTGMGLDYFYGFVGGDANQWQPNLFRNTTAIYPYYNNPGWNLVTAQADDAIQYLDRITAIEIKTSPSCLLRAWLGSRSPSSDTGVDQQDQRHAPVRQGWNTLRDNVFVNEKRLGVIPQNAKLTPRPDNLLKRWDQLTPEEQKLFNRQAEVFAAYWAYIDHEIGRVIQHIEDMGKLDNTLIIYLAGDNGNSAEGSLAGTPNEVASLQGIDVPVADQLKLNDA
jgi:arylsulfatase